MNRPPWLSLVTIFMLAALPLGDLPGQQPAKKDTGKPAAKKDTKKDTKKDDRPWLTVKVLAVGMMDDDGGRPCQINVNEVQAQVARANQIFSSAHIRFEYGAKKTDAKKTDTITLRSTVINSLIPDAQKAKPEDRVPGAAENEDKAAKVADEFGLKYPDHMVVFFRYGDSTRGPTGNGFSWSDRQFVAMPGFKATNMGLRGLAHEAGHYLGLAHTFGPSFKTVDEAAKYLKERGNDPKVFDGDGLSDTLPDPGLPIPGDDGITATVKINGINFELPRGNIMSYYSPIGDRPEWLSPMQGERARQFCQVRFTKNRPGKGALSFETLRIVENKEADTSPQEMTQWDKRKWSTGKQLFCGSRRAGPQVTFELPVAKEGSYKIVLYATRAPDYGILSLSLDGKAFASPFDGYAVGVMASGPIVLGTRPLTEGKHRLTFEVTGKNAASGNYFFGLDAIELQAEAKKS